MHDDGPGGGFRAAVAASRRPLAGLWLSSGSPLVAEICADAGLDWLLIDTEHDPCGPGSALAQLEAVRGYPVTAVVRAPGAAALRPVLDGGARDVLVPVDSPGEARAAAEAVRGATCGHGSLVVQVGSVAATASAAAVAAVDGVDGVLLDPSDLAATMGLLGRQTHPDVVAAVQEALDAVRGAGALAGVSVPEPGAADAYAGAGASFVLVGADVTLLSRGTTELAARFELPRRSSDYLAGKV